MWLRRWRSARHRWQMVRTRAGDVQRFRRDRRATSRGVRHGGEIDPVDDAGLSQRMFSECAAAPADGCVVVRWTRANAFGARLFLGRPASKGIRADVPHRARRSLGSQLAREAPAPLDYVRPMPDSGRSAALGCSPMESKIPFVRGDRPTTDRRQNVILPHKGKRDRERRRDEEDETSFRTASRGKRIITS